MPKDAPILVTPEGHKKVAEEMEHLWKVERPAVTAEVEAAAALGDRSENAEYQYGKRRLREIDRRLRFLGGRLDRMKVMTPQMQAASAGKVVGDEVEVRRPRGDAYFTIENIVYGDRPEV
jgi:transcription elongation factor GreB